MAEFRLHRDASTERLHVALDDVHADAAPGDVGDHIRSRERGQKDQIVDLVVAEMGAGRAQATALGLGQDLLAVDAAAVVGDLDDDAATALRRRQMNRALPWLARPPP